ncbi:MAG: hypothetical protein KKG09_02190 [Verrucomicrobia bacterium]|nr:hypothetical protein [Verrucomicrobiota bacterium]MBU4246913.1 hypothetical protein [Verrucomicrobiota bacterium]MBU4291301.1 hypothetical protein [Verrucomicrobiota bacterium]MBU4496804.1 hypothetical protein [Verrucomicrobiota bacterium]MCG2680775.1 hypothetical protein [Kiritimatiellia bacterium]
MKHRLTAIFVGLAILALVLPAFGKVFWQWRSGTGSAIFDTTPGWQRIYQSNIRINGGRGHLKIMGCEDAIPSVMAKLRTAFTAAHPGALFRHNTSGGWSLIRTADAVIRTLVLNLGTSTPTMVFVLTQSHADYEQSLKPPPTHLLNAAPFYPGSITQSFMEDEEAAAQLEISSAPARPESVWSFLESAFDQNGYHRMQAAGKRDQADSGIAVFQKGPSLCYVLVQAAPHSNESTITVLHKQLRME